MPLHAFLPQISIKPILEMRARFERRVDRDFDRAVSDNRSDLLSRFRAGVSFAGGKTKGQLVYQYAHDEAWLLAGNRALWRSDVLLANIETPVGEGRLTVGRQRLRVGSERLLSALEWNNVSFAWDGLRYQVGRVQAFSAKMGVGPVPNDEVRIFGAVSGGTLVVYKHDGRGAGVDEATVSYQSRLESGRLRIDAEAAVQAGHRGSRRKLAGALDAIATYPATSRVTLGAKASVSSGGGDGGTTRTFDQLYPAAHDRHGLLDVAGSQNLRDLGLWVQYAPDPASSLKLQYHRLGLDSARDAWYGANGLQNGKFNDPTGSRGRELGDELDLDASHRLNAHQTIQGGIGMFRPGRYVRSFNGGRTEDQVWGYVQWQYRF